MTQILGLEQIDLKKLNTNELKLICSRLGIRAGGIDKSSLMKAFFDRLNNPDAVSAASSIESPNTPVLAALAQFKTEIIDAVYEARTVFEEQSDEIQDSIIKLKKALTEKQVPDKKSATEQVPDNESNGEEEEEEEEEQEEEEEEEEVGSEDSFGTKEDIQIKVVLINGDDKTKVKLWHHSTVGEVKALALGDEWMNYDAFYESKKMHNEQRLSKHKVCDKAKIFLIPRIPGGGKKGVKKDLLRKVAQLKGENPLNGPITDEELLKACQVSTKVMKIKSVKFQEYFSALPLKVMTDIIEYLKHDKAHHRVKLESLHEFLPDVKSILAGASHFEAVADHMKEVVSNSIILNFTSLDGTLDVKKVATELEVYHKVEEIKQKDKMGD